jgi:hypothetical protein
LGSRLSVRKVVDVSGRPVSIGVRGTGPLIVFFGSPTCNPCKVSLNALNKFLQSRVVDARLFMVATRTAAEVASQWTAAAIDGATVIADPTAEIQSAYKIVVVPFVIVTSSEGHVIRRQVIGSDWSWLEEFAPTRSADRVTA